jgi:large conductance mechanosensitive channel
MFGDIVKSLVDDILMPPIGLVTGGIDFGDKFVILKEGPRLPHHTPRDARGDVSLTPTHDHLFAGR